MPLTQPETFEVTFVSHDHEFEVQIDARSMGEALRKARQTMERNGIPDWEVMQITRCRLYDLDATIGRQVVF